MAAEQAREPPAQGQAEAGALHLRLQGVPHLRELLEDALVVLGRDADAGVGDREHHRRAPGVELGADADLAALGELERVGDQVAQDLRDLALVAVQGRQAERRLEAQRHAVAHQQRPQHAAQRAEQLLDREFRRVELHLAGLDLGEVEQVLDQLGEALGRLGDEVELAHLLVVHRTVGALEQEARERADRVERRAELVAHVGEEAALGLVGAAQEVGALLELGVQRHHAAVGVLQLAVDVQHLVLALP